MLHQLFQAQRDSSLLFSVRLLEVAFGGVRLYFEEIVVFSAVKDKLYKVRRRQDVRFFDHGDDRG